VSLFLGVFFALTVAFSAAALTPESTIEEVMAAQKVPGFYLEFRYTTEYISITDRFLGRKNYWALRYLGFEKPASIKSELFPWVEEDYHYPCPTPPNRLRIHLKDGTELDYIGRNSGFSVADGFGGVFDSHTPLPINSPLYPHTIKCFTVRFVKLHEIKCEDFISCIYGKISKKFPFDILFNLPSTEITCPKVNFFGSEFDLCFIYEAMRLFKYPIAAALIIKLFLYL
jgi:hypothetical protein